MRKRFIQILCIVLIVIGVVLDYDYVRIIGVLRNKSDALTARPGVKATRNKKYACDASCCESAFFASRPRELDGQPLFYNLSAGELPGYTGWARPEYTLASHFRVVGNDGNDEPKVGEDWVVRLHCTTEQCATNSSNRGALFYARAYGPAVVPGRVEYPNEQKSDDTYSIFFHFFDEGTYFVEIVLTFSQSPPWGDYPLQMEGQNEPFYEGYTIEGFPMSICVAPSTSTAKVGNKVKYPLSNGMMPNFPSQSWCNLEQLELHELDDSVSFARWKIYDRNDHPSHEHVLSNPKSMSLRGYQVSQAAIVISSR